MHRLLEAVRARHDQPDELNAGDLHFPLDGGNDIMDRMTAFFARKRFKSKLLHVNLDADSVADRMGRIHGITTHNTHRTLTLVADSWPSTSALRCVARQYYKGSTSANSITDVVLDDLDSLWHLPWHDKQALCGKRGFVLASGPGPTTEEDDDDMPGVDCAPFARTASQSCPVRRCCSTSASGWCWT